MPHLLIPVNEVLRRYHDTDKPLYAFLAPVKATWRATPRFVAWPCG